MFCFGEMPLEEGERERVAVLYLDQSELFVSVRAGIQ